MDTTKTAIIIGATSGIGREVAHQLAGQGWRLGIAGRRGELLEQFKDEHPGADVTTAIMDVTKDDATQALDSLLQTLGRADVLLYSSGVGYQNRELLPEKEISTVRTNCEGMVRIVGHFFNHVRTNKAFYARQAAHNTRQAAHIAVLSSLAGTKGLGTAPAYSATKRMESTYVTALCQLARMERIPVTFTDIRPGFVKTPILNPDKHYPMAIPVEKAAASIIKAIERRKRVKYIDWKFALIATFWTLIPDWIWERLTAVKN